MKNFVDWLVEKLNNENVEETIVLTHTKASVVKQIKLIHALLLSEHGKHNGDCVRHLNASLITKFCEICQYQIWLDEYEWYARNFKEDNKS